MSKKRILNFIRENRDLIKSAPVEQKVKLLKLIRSTMNSPARSEIRPTAATPTPPANSDYLDER